MALLFTVDTVEDLSPHMRRFTFSGDAVGAYIATGQFPNIKIFLPHPDGTYDVPELDDPTSGTETVLRSRPELHARVRTYTVRRYDREKNTLSIDFVLHGDEGIASAWAMRARPGTTLGIAGGGGRHIGQGDHYLIAGDETGLPGIGDILDNLPADATGTAYIEVAGDSGRIDLTKPEGIEVVWLSRDGAPGGTTTLLVDSVRSHELKPNTFAWPSAESAQVIAIRKNLRARGVDRKSMLVIGYWRRGLSENGYAKAANHDRDLKEYDDHEHDHDHGVGAAMREGAAHLAGRLRRRRRT